MKVSFLGKKKRWCINSQDVGVSRFNDNKELSSEKTKYRVTHWAEYDQALVNRGDVTVWFEKAYLEKNWVAKSTGKQGAPKVYSDEAIRVMFTLKSGI